MGTKDTQGPTREPSRAADTPLKVVTVPAGFDSASFDRQPRSLDEYIGILHAHRQVVGTCLAFGVGLAVAALMVMPRQYTASTVLQLSRASPIELRLDENVVRTDDRADRSSSAAAYLATQVQALGSRDLAEGVLRRHDLGRDGRFPAPRPSEIEQLTAGLTPRFRPRGAATTAPTSIVPALPDVEVVDPYLVDDYMDALAARELQGTNLVEIQFTTSNPALSAFLAAAHAEAYFESTQDTRRSTDATARRFLAEQRVQAEADLTTAALALNDFARAHPDVAAYQDEQHTTNRLTELSRLLTAAEAERVRLESRYDFLTQPDSDRDAFFQDDAAVRNLRLALADVRTQLQGLSSRLGSRHRRIRELTTREAELMRAIDVEINRAAASVRARFDTARSEEARLQELMSELENRNVDLQKLGVTYGLLRRQVESAQTVYESLLGQERETAIGSHLVPSMITVVERPEVPRKATSPQVPGMLLLGLFAGAGLGLTAALGREYLDTSVRDGDDASSLLQIPTLATIPGFTHLLAPHERGTVSGVPSLIVRDHPTSVAGEAFRQLRAALLCGDGDGAPRVVAVTSAGPGEGKTTTCLNLATALAEAGARVILLDFDLRRPRCHAALNVDNRTGLSTYLAGTTDLAGVTYALHRPSIAFIPAGPPPENPAELINSLRTQVALQELRASFDVVIIDTPPVLSVSDASLVGREADGVLLVIQGHATPRELARRARNQLLQAGTTIIGSIVNDIDEPGGAVERYASRARYVRDQVRAS